MDSVIGKESPIESEDGKFALSLQSDAKAPTKSDAAITQVGNFIIEFLREVFFLMNAWIEFIVFLTLTGIKNSSPIGLNNDCNYYQLTANYLLLK